MAVDRETRSTEHLIFTWDETFEQGGQRFVEGDDAVMFSQEDAEDPLELDAFDGDGKNVFSMEFSVEEEEALRDLLNERHRQREGA